MPDEQVLLGGYRRANVLQTGQNSEVWEVVDPTGGQRYAMKLLLSERTGDRLQRRMLAHEARVGLSLTHPRIIRFYRYVRDRLNPFILMEFFPSQNLKLRILRGQTETFIRPRLRTTLEQLTGALDYVHSKGWVHRDIKPDNVLINSAGEIRLIDFALAQKAAGGFWKRFARRGGVTAGTRSYMSPEQIRGLPLDRRADIYSLGVLTYEILTGRLPFVASSGAELLRKHLLADVPSIPPEKNVTTDFEQLLARMLAKREKDRPATLGEFQNELRRIKIFKDEKEVEKPEWGIG